jgi:alpha-beta hydrolase superfamily lysophospholipase
VVMEKLFIKNRQGQNISVVLERVVNSKGLVFVMHGLGGSKKQPHIATFASTFSESGYDVVRFDTTNTFGESDGKYEDATVTNYYDDLEDVIQWAKGQHWYREPFVLVGHSLGGLCTALFTERYPDKVKALAPISSVVSNTLFLETHSEEELKKWKADGYLRTESKSAPGGVKTLKWTFVEDRLQYDLLENAHKLTMPVLLIVGENDTRTPVKHQQLLFEKLPGKKELHIIRGAEHTFRDTEHLNEISRIFTKWIGNL